MKVTNWSTEIFIHIIVMINKHLHCFGAVYYKKNPGEEGAPSLERS
jgi:hypothetical protein